MQRKNDETPKAGTNEVSILSATCKELTMNSIATTESAIKQGMQAIIHSGVPVVTTEQLSSFYGTGADNIKKNYSRNSSRFELGKHYFMITGSELRSFKDSVTFGHLVDKRAPKLTLWTERGAARHAKMLETNRAWDVYEQLEDCYFTQKEKIEAPRKKTTVDERTPLRDAVNMLVGKKGLRYDDAYNMVHQRFAIDSIDELELSQIPLAVEYIHRVVLEGEYLGKQRNEVSDGFDWEMNVHNLNASCIHLDFMYRIWRDELEPALRLLSSPVATKFCGRIADCYAVTASVKSQMERASGLKGLQYKGR
ncbi:ORF6N domain-containing protein [Rahnella woolbedingensis]|uniref:ORF6N domain-containing protein n=1 Tax=Rahnella woolbedingensis TaxID=1510574 RepID=A0A419NEQ5_9GAMM|nr:ORF6N domain-containing protein [Rahnella woolbedingensis]RJT47250.1 ORF6N domain-containing protein [Rahnella woolbedingensis]